MRSLLILLFLLSAYTTLLAQSARWEAGFSLDAANYMGDIVATKYFTPKETNPAIGFFLRRNIGRSLSLRLNLTAARISGKDTNFSDPPWRQVRQFSFATNMVELALLGELDPLGRRRYKRGRLHKIFSPYFFSGVAGIAFSPSNDYKEEYNQGIIDGIIIDKRGDYEKIGLAIPVGAGFRLDLSRKTTLGIEGGLRIPFTDYLDGVSYSGNPKARDFYVFGGFTLAFRFRYYKDSDGDRLIDRYDACPDMPGEDQYDGCPDTDGDGIIDQNDKCPYQRGGIALKGCPDKDGDGVADVDDECPDVPGLIPLAGCPDKDGDGFADIKDDCPDLAGATTAKGCPDMDGDSIPDTKDKCPKEAGLFVFDGCPDTDKDSIPDIRDKCPKEAGLLVNDGCPDRDMDGDSVVDRLDRCPNKAGLAKFRGCPDTDNDGVADPDDRCPTAAGDTTNFGCPIVKKEEKEVLVFAMRGVKFDVGKATLKKESFAVLDQIVEIMKRYPDYNLKISGHTDSDGNDAKNMTLSENRAKTCRDYFVKKEIAEKRLLDKGFGETVPMVPNTTKQNKQLNRRVEFEMVLPDS